MSMCRSVKDSRRYAQKVGVGVSRNESGTVRKPKRNYSKPKDNYYH